MGSQAELLKKKREARKAKILSNSQDRLDLITSSYSAPAPELEKSDFANEMASLAPKDEGKREECEKRKESSDQTVGCEDLKSINPKEIPKQQTPLFVAEAELPSHDPLSSLENFSNDDNQTESSTQSPGLQFSDTLAWAHASLLTIGIIWCLGNWILFHTHDMFSLGDIAQDLWHKRLCRQLYHMAYNPIHTDLGASSVIIFFGYSSPAWQFFLTLELILLSARFYAIQKSKKTAPFVIPEMIKAFMRQFGFNPEFYEKIISSAYGYYDMYDTLMRDMYLVIAIIGSIICFSVIAHSLDLCH